MGHSSFFGQQPRQTGAGVKPRHPAPARINHELNAIDGEAAFGQGCGQHHLAATWRSSSHRCVLGARIEITKQGRELHVSRKGVLQLLQQTTDLRLTRKKHQDAALLRCQGLPDRRAHLISNRSRTGLIRSRPLGIDSFNRKRAALTAQHRGVIEQPRQWLGIKGG